MAQNVTIAGNQYPSVPSILVPKTGGGGNATFTDTSPTTASASDVAQGKIFFDSTGTQQTGTASGGGGASNLVTGTFTGTTTGAAMDVTLNYSGSGYPVAFHVYVSEGPYNPLTGTFYNLVQRYAIAWISGVKKEITSIPNYSNDITKNHCYTYRYYKSNSTNAEVYSGGVSTNAMVYSTGAATTSTVVKFSDSTHMSVFIASTSYGFAANIEYTYWVMYSS